EEDAEPTIMNEWGSIPGNFPRVEIWMCTNSSKSTSNISDTDQPCAPQSEIDRVLKDFYLVMKLPSFYVDLNDYDQPYKPFIFSFTTPMTMGTSKNMLVNLKKSHLYTDSGFLFQDNANSSYPLIDYIRSETNIQD